MTPLLSDDYAPITSSIGFFEAPADAVFEALVEWRERLGDRIQTSKLHDRFPAVLHRLAPLSVASVTNELLLTTDSRWTAYFDNGWRGTDASGPLAVLCQAVGCHGVEATCIPNSLGRVSTREQKGRYGAVMFVYYGPEPAPSLNELRAIGAANDGGRWTFVDGGEPLPFENPQTYRERVIRARFPAQLLDAYCQALGIRYFDREFYRGAGYLIRNLTQEGYAARFMSLDESRAEHGLPPAPRDG